MDTVPESSLEAGLTALEQSDFERAIAILEAVCQNSLAQNATKVQAQKGLVTAYVKLGEDNKAIALWQILSQNSDAQVQAWAISHYPQFLNLTPIDTTGFVAFEEVATPLQPKSIDKDTDNLLKAIPPPLAQKTDEIALENHQENSFAATPFQWQNAPRTKRWQPLKAVNLGPLWLLMAGSAIALFWLLRELLKFAMLFINDLLVKLPYLEPFQLFYRDPAELIFFLLFLLAICSPWLLDCLFQLSYQSQSLSLNQLTKYSPEAGRLLQRFCRQQGWPLPSLIILPTAAPIACTYGNLRRTARIAVSQKLLEQLADDEIASIYAVQLGHIASMDFAVMSLFLVVTQGVYAVYRQISTWGDRVTNSALKITAAIVASAAYGLWWLLGLPALWLSQLRIYYSDRFVVNVTGNPNGLSRALIKIAIGVTKDIQQQECTSWLLESLNLFMPVGFYQAITLGSLHAHTNIEPILAWDCLNPYRYLLTINNTHPLIGDRLQRLNAFARYWHLDSELKLPDDRVHLTLTVQNLFAQSKSLLTRQALLQFGAVFGIVLGIVLGMFTWLVGAIALIVWIPQLAWMYGDGLLIKAFITIALSISLFLRVNVLFPDITLKTVRTTPNLIRQLATPTALPIDSQTVCWQGKLLGRQGIANWLGQDLWLNSSQGLVKLHYQSPLGAIGNVFFRQSFNPMDLLGRQVMATGWFRRSATSWIDINTLQTQAGKVSYSYQPFWATIAALAIALYGTAIIVWGK
jgi:Zn-dependent protease with chaperone function